MMDVCKYIQCSIALYCFIHTESVVFGIYHHIIIHNSEFAWTDLYISFPQLLCPLSNHSHDKTRWTPLKALVTWPPSPWSWRPLGFSFGVVFQAVMGHPTNKYNLKGCRGVERNFSFSFAIIHVSATNNFPEF